MNPGGPSFYRLLHRGRYHPAKQKALGATKDGRLERERFAASAISFCLKHDEQFRTHFWTSVCRPQGSTEKTPTLRPEDVWLEPPLWADLSLRYEDGDGRQTWIVIEVKTGARLKTKQNPLEKAFFARRGYGALFLKQPMSVNARRQYVVLGASEPLNIHDGESPRGIEIQQRSWGQLLAERPKTALTNDLVDSLGKLYIDAFMTDEAKEIELTSGLTNVGKAWEVLEAVCQRLGVTVAAQKEYGAYHDGDQDVLGIDLKRPAKRTKPSPLYTNICALAGTRSVVAWFGYMTNGNQPVKKSVYFYCKNASTQSRLKTILKEKFDQPAPGADREPKLLYVTVECPPEAARVKDMDWFVSVFEQAAKAGKRTR